MAKTPSPSSDSVVVIGLGRFGGAVAESLARLGHQVLGIDEDAGLVQSWADRLTHVVQADSTNSDTLRRLGVQEFERAVVGIGTDLEASVLTVLALSELGIKDIWAKALSSKHGRILERTGAHHVIYPEVAMGERVAHLVTGKMIDFME
ncbi:MAG TPA: TrkA family potassium uptake protein, partial [Roseomonas sp.]